MSHDERKKYIAIGLIAFCVIAASALLIFLIFHFEVISGLILRIWRVLMPFVYGFVLAYLLLPVYNMLRSLFRKWLCRGDFPEKKLRRRRATATGLSVSLTILFFLALLIGFGFLVLPELGRSIISIIRSAPETGRRVVSWAEKLLQDNPEIEATVTDLISRYIGDVESWAESTLLPYATEFVNGLSNSIIVTVTETFNFIKNTVIGLIAAIYMLVSKERFSAQGKKLTYSIFPVKTANLVLENLRFIHRTFSGFISGRLLDGLIIGFLCYLFCVIAGMPYAVLISVLIGVTNVIPFFGPFLGAIPSGLLILTVSPLQCLTFVIFILILQQFDGNVLGPRILSGTVGISSFWVMFSIIVFGGLFGFLGMLIGVPLGALILSLIAALCRISLQHKSLPVDSGAYTSVKSFDPESGEPVPLPPKPGLRDKPGGVISGILKRFRKKK